MLRAIVDALSVLTGAFMLGITDTAATVVATIDALGELAALGDVTSITLTDGGTPALALSATQAGDDAAALAVIAGAYTVAVTDTAADVAANLDALQALGTNLTGITLTDTGTPTIAITQAQLTADAGALAAIAGTYDVALSGVTAASAASAVTGNVVSVSVADTGANVAANIDGLQALAVAGELAGIAFTDAGAPTLAVTAAQYANDTGAVAAMAGAYGLAVSGVSVANAASVAAGANVASVGITDTAANVAANIDALQALSLAGQLGAVTLTDTGTPTLAVTSAQLAIDAGAVAAITGAYTLAVSGIPAASAAGAVTGNVASVAVADTAAKHRRVLKRVADAGWCGGACGHKPR